MPTTCSAGAAMNSWSCFRELQSEFSRSSTVSALPEGVGLSFGCAEVSALAESATEALHLADERMYADKRAARLPLLETLERTGEG